MNTEGRVQMANRAAFAPGEAREDWAILRALSDVLGHRLPFDSLECAAREALRALSRISRRSTRSSRRMRPQPSRRSPMSAATLGREPFASPVKDFYLTNPIARASGVMAECSALAR